MPTTYAIPNGATAMTATTYSGNSASPQAFTNGGNNNTGVTFLPDLVWIKNRSSGSYWNVWFDTVRGAGNQLSSNQSDAELASASNVAGKISAFNSNGFSTAAGSVSSTSVNTTGNNYVAWQWNAGSNTTTTNTTGTITSTVSANTTAGFSIVTYTGTGSAATIGHGLGVAPKFLIVKNRTQAGNAWGVWTIAFGGTASDTDYVLLNDTGAKGYLGAVALWNNTAPTSSVFSIGTQATTNRNGDGFVAYCWTAVPGFSAFGSYTGNGSTDGPFIYTGFRPKFWMAKRTDVGAPWLIYDSARNTSNVVNNYLIPNASDAEASGSSPNDVNDFLSNGFKLRCSNAGENASGGTYIYMAFAETPFKFSNAR